MERRRAVFLDISILKEFFLLSVVVLVYCSLIWADFIIGFRLPFHDTIGFFYPWRQFFSDCFQQSVTPLWDSWSNPGFPITFLTAPLWNPIAYIFSIAKDYDIYRIMAEIYFLSYLSAIGFYYWLRHQRISLILSLSGAAAWISSAPFLTSIQGITIYTTISFIPWIFLGITLLVESDNWRNCLAGVIVTSIAVWVMIAGGYTGLTIPVFFFVLIYTIFLLCLNIKSTGRSSLYLLLTIFLSLLLISGPITDYLHVKEYLMKLRELAIGGYDPFTSSLPLNSIWTLLLGNGGYLPNITIGRAEQLYMGTVFFLAIPGCLMILKLNRKDLFFFIFSVFVFLSAMGSVSPVARFVVETIPLLSLFRHHVFWSSLFIFLLLTLSLRLLNRLIEDKELGEISFIKIGTFYLMFVGVFLAGAFCSVDSEIQFSDHFVFSYFEIFQYLFFIFLLVYILFFAIMKDYLQKRYFTGALFALVVIFLSSLVWLLQFRGLEMLSVFAETVGGEATYLETTGLSLKSKLLVNRISFPSIVMLLEDLSYLFVLLSAFIVVTFKYFQSKKNVWLYCFIIISAVDMVCVSHRYFHGNLQYLGNTVESDKYFLEEKVLDVSKLEKFQDGYYSSTRIESSVIKGDLIEFEIEMLDPPDSSMTVFIIIYKNGSSQRVIEKEFNYSDFNNNKIIFSGLARNSLSNFSFEIRFYNCMSIPRPRTAKVSFYRTVPSISFNQSERPLTHVNNDRLTGADDKPQFYHNRTPVLSSYMPLFHPVVRDLVNEKNGRSIFAKLLWIIPVNKDVDTNSWLEFAKEPDIKFIQLSPNSLQADIVADGPSKLVWSDAWDSGWRATLNDQEIVVEKSLGALKAITIPAGRSIINFSYHRKDREVSMVLTILGILLVVVFMGIIFLNRKAPHCT
ncbi:MAG: hypothetical protein VR65_07990 [Desulfobulbaceae bacterium BRH_c16a]|nr:MAG: hypothetical protein VR65_07990 [Desulfobulbaceae bacterium BRH_c16a]